MNALILIEHNPLAELLRAAENIAHLEWSKDTENFKGAYSYGADYLSLMKQAAAQVLRRIYDDGTKEDRQLLKDVFSLPRVDEDDSAAQNTRRRKRAVRPKDKGVTSEPVVDIEPSGPKPFTLHKIAGGFTVTGNPSVPSSLRHLNVTMAYDRRDGSPIRKYHPADFRVEKLPAELDGVRLAEAKKNVVRLDILRPDFRFSLRGFDPNRQVIVRANAVESRSGETSDA